MGNENSRIPKTSYKSRANKKRKSLHFYYFHAKSLSSLYSPPIPTTQTHKMSETTTQIAAEESDPKEPRNPFSFFPKLKLHWPFPKPEERSSAAGEGRSEATAGKEASGEAETPKPAMVRFPKAQMAVPPPVAVENEETGKTSNPIILWQVN